MRHLTSYAVVVQIYFSNPALSWVAKPSTISYPMSQPSIFHGSARKRATILYLEPDDFQSSLERDLKASPGGSRPPPVPPSTYQPMNATTLTPPEDLPDDVPKDVSKEKLQETIDSQDKTLYEILGATQNDSRTDIKKKYAKLARVSHPDALIGNNSENNGGDLPDFQEIAAAWRILGDSKSRKRYDRELQYKQWSNTASKYANEKLEEAVPAVAKIMDDVAVPFLRRTAATTFAVGQAVNKIREVASGKGDQSSKSGNESSDSGGQSSSSGSTLTDAFMTAIQAGRQAGRVIDSIELEEKSEQLNQRAAQDRKRATEVEKELQSVTEKRMLATLQSTQFSLSSGEARQVLDRLSEDRSRQRDRIEKDIDSLQETEQHFVEKLAMYEETDRHWNDILEKQEGAKANLSNRKKEEIAARKRLEEAIQMVYEAKASLVTSSTELLKVEQKMKRNSSEMDRVTATLTKKQERVRSVLKSKLDSDSGEIQVDYLSEDEIAELRRKEIQLMGESQQLSKMVERLSSRAQKLKARADALQRVQSTPPPDEQAST